MAWRKPQVEWRSETRHLLNRVILVVVVANAILLLVTQLGDDDSSTSTSTSTTQRGSTTVPLVTSPARQAAPRAATARTQTVGGATLSLQSFEFPATGLAQAPKPRSGYTFAAADIEGCAAPGGTTRFDRLRFLLELSDQRKIQTVAGARQPVFATLELAPGRCTRGWVSFEVPRAAKPAFLVYQGSSTLRWAIS